MTKQNVLVCWLIAAIAVFLYPHYEVHYPNGVRGDVGWNWVGTGPQTYWKQTPYSDGVERTVKGDADPDYAVVDKTLLLIMEGVLAALAIGVLTQGNLPSSQQAQRKESPPE